MEEDDGDVGIEMAEFDDEDGLEAFEAAMALDSSRDLKEMQYDEKLEESRMANLNAVVSAAQFSSNCLQWPAVCLAGLS